MAQLIAQGNLAVPNSKSAIIINARLKGLAFVLASDASVLGYKAAFEGIDTNTKSYLVSANYNEGTRQDLSEEDSMNILRTLLEPLKIKKGLLEEIHESVRVMGSPLLANDNGFGAPFGKYYSTECTRKIIEFLKDVDAEVNRFQMQQIERKDRLHTYVDFVGDMDAAFAV